MGLDSISRGIVEREFEKRLKKGFKMEVLTRPNCTLCNEAVRFISDLCKLSKGAIKMEVKREAVMHPSIQILENLAYYGLPTDRQTWVFIQFLMDLSGGVLFLDKETAKGVGKIDRDVDVEVYITPSCTHSPLQVRWAYEFAVLNKRINVKIIDAVEFENMAVKNHVHSTPTTIMNGKIRVIGAANPEEFLRKMKEAIY